MRDAVADLVRDGDTVAIEGFTHLIGFAAGHEIIRQGRRDLTLARLTPDLVKDVRGKGLMIGIQFDSGETADAVQMQAFDRGLLVLEAGDDCVRMSPPLVVSQAEADTAIRLFTESVAHVAGHRAEDVAERKAAQRAGYATEGFGASGR
jgi:hypothetical protein